MDLFCGLYNRNQGEDAWRRRNCGNLLLLIDIYIYISSSSGQSGADKSGYGYRCSFPGSCGWERDMANVSSCRPTKMVTARPTNYRAKFTGKLPLDESLDCLFTLEIGGDDIFFANSYSILWTIIIRTTPNPNSVPVDHYQAEFELAHMLNLKIWWAELHD